MKTAVFGKCLLSILMLSLYIGPASADSLKTEALEQKINEISSLRAKLIDKIDQAIEMRTSLEGHLSELVDEIHAEQIHYGINTHLEAVQNHRIRYNLRLIQVFQAYVIQLNERMAYFQTGSERLKFLVHQIKDDMAMINTLKDMDIERLIERINLVLDEFIPEMKKQIFDATDIHVTPLELVWNEISIKSS